MTLNAQQILLVIGLGVILLLFGLPPLWETALTTEVRIVFFNVNNWLVAFFIWWAIVRIGGSDARRE